MPRFGELLATDVWAAATRDLTNPSGVFSDASRTLTNPTGVFDDTLRDLTDLSAEEIFDLPIFDSLYPATTVVSSGTANTFGSWAEISADIGAGKRLIGCILTELATAALDYELEFGEGAGGSEAAVARFCGSQLTFDLSGYVTAKVVPLWLALSDNARLSARVKDTLASIIGYKVTVQVA